MTTIAYYAKSRPADTASARALSVTRQSQRQYPTTTVERFLLMAIVVILPLETHIPAVAGFSITYILFAVQAGYVILWRFRALARTWLHPVFLAGYILLAVGCVVEPSHPYASYTEIFRLGLVIVAAIFVASFCRDRRALRASMYGFLAAGVWMSVLLFLTTYGALRGATSTSFHEASKIREAVSEVIPLQSNLNGMARVAATGAVVAVALALAAKSSRRRNLFLGIALFCLVAAFLPMSRSGVVFAGIACATVMFKYGVNIRVIIASAILGVGILIWVPHVVFSRLTFSTEVVGGRMESRAQIYTAAVTHLPEYILTGVGVGNFWGPWGMHSQFAGRDVVTGAHNGFVQVTIYWGLAGLAALLAVVWQAYRCLPRRYGADELSLCLLGITTVNFFAAWVAHDLTAKIFALGLGTLVGARCWIWPQGVVQSVARKHKRYYLQPAIVPPREPMKWRSHADS